MDNIRKQENKGWFYSFNMVFNMELSCHAKLVYVFLCRCADSESQSFPSKNTIAQKCSISVTSVKNALKELIEARLLTKEEQFRPDGGQTSNLFTIYSEPYESDNKPTEIPASDTPQSKYDPSPVRMRPP